MVKIIATDMDGTLLDSKKTSKRLWLCIRKIR